MKKKKQKKNKQHKIQNENSRRTGVRGRERKSNDRPSSTVGEREVGGRSIPRRERESCRSSYAAAEMTGPLSYSLFYLSLSLLHSLAIPPPTHPFPSSSSRQPKSDEADSNPFPSLRLHVGSRAWPSIHDSRSLPLCPTRRELKIENRKKTKQNKRQQSRSALSSNNKPFPCIHQFCESWRIEIDCKTDRWGVPQVFPSAFFYSSFSFELARHWRFYIEPYTIYITSL